MRNCPGVTSRFSSTNNSALPARYAAAAVEYGWSRNVLHEHDHEQDAGADGRRAIQLCATACCAGFRTRPAGRQRPLQLRIPRSLRRSRRTRPRERPDQQDHRNPPRTGPGFAFVGRQVHFDVDGDDFYVDLLFFHIEHSRYVVIELKTGKFQPEYAGKLNFYVALVDDVLRRGHHNETIGILICGTKNDRSVRYSLGRSTSPMAVAAYTYDKLPPAEQQALPNEGHIVAALEWAEPDGDADAAGRRLKRSDSSQPGALGKNVELQPPVVKMAPLPGMPG